MSELFGLEPEERTTLLELARTSIVTGLAGQELPSTANLRVKLHRLAGAFVTLHRGGRLRGCIGRIQAVGPLCRTVQEMARQAAFADPRFPPVKLEEVPEIDLEISVLTPFETITDVSRVKIGVHGLYISAHGRAGLLLPQVATEQGWNVTEFLAHTCGKAGLPPDTWQKGAKIEIFAAEVFGELEVSRS